MRYTVAIFVPCPKCGHNNKPHKTVRESVRLWLIDQLPPCRACGRQLRKVNYIAPANLPHLKELREKLGIK